MIASDAGEVEGKAHPSFIPSYSRARRKAISSFSLCFSQRASSACDRTDCTE